MIFKRVSYMNKSAENGVLRLATDCLLLLFLTFFWITDGIRAEGSIRLLFYPVRVNSAYKGG